MTGDGLPLVLAVERFFLDRSAESKRLSLFVRWELYLGQSGDYPHFFSNIALLFAALIGFSFFLASIRLMILRLALKRPREANSHAMRHDRTVCAWSPMLELLHLEGTDQPVLPRPPRYSAHRRWAGASEGADQTRETRPQRYSGHRCWAGASEGADQPRGTRSVRTIGSTDARLRRDHGGLTELVPAASSSTRRSLMLERKSFKRRCPIRGSSDEQDPPAPMDRARRAYSVQWISLFKRQV